MFSLVVLAEDFEMTCQHSFQGNYSGGQVLLKYEYNFLTEDKAFIQNKGEWTAICSDMETHGMISINNFIASCSIYFPNWMNQRRRDFIWDFKAKELYVQTLSKILNPDTNEKEWQWRYSVGELFTDDWKVINVWESNGIEYKKKKCKCENY